MFDAAHAARRFGYGLSPVVGPPDSLAAMLGSIGRTDPVEARFPLPDYRHMQGLMVRRRRFMFYARKVSGKLAVQDAKDRANAIKDQIRAEHARWFVQVLLRRTKGRSGVRERLLAFWADHFTAFGGGGLLPLAAPIYAEEAVRPHLTGRFGDMLVACVTHPLMLRYLDQGSSIGPNSPAARGANGKRGLNENLAREVIELHTLGVNAGYDQNDVRELAKLFTGMSNTLDFGFRFRARRAEPGAETILGVTYADDGGMDAITEALYNLARHPATARHIATKLVTHFVADDPPAKLVAAVEDTFLTSDGDLMACYSTLFEHPEAWHAAPRNMRPPVEFVTASIRALDPPETALQALDRKAIKQMFLRPLAKMGQDWMHPAGPDGFEEADAAWITPQGIAARVEWAMHVPARLLDALPKQDAFLQTALGDASPAAVRFAASAAENRAVAVGLILSAPAFQRR